MKYKILYWIFAIILLSSFCFASSEWQTSTYASQEGLQITYPKFDYYNENQDTIRFNFQVYDEYNNPFNSSNTSCTIYFYNSTGHLLLNSSLTYMIPNWYYNLDISTATTKQFYYTVYCVSGNGDGFMSNNFEINETGRKNDTGGYLAISVIMLGIVMILAYLSRNTPDKLVSGLFSMLSIALFVGIINFARLIAITEQYSTNIIQGIWVIEWVTVIFLLLMVFLMMFNFIYALLQSMGKIKGSQ